MQQVAIVLTLLAAVVLSGAIARATKIAAPLVQIALGVVIALLPVATVRLEPQVFFLLFLPPLLFLDGWRIPKRDLYRHRIIIGELALGLVVLTVVGLGWAIHWLIPAMPLPVAFALAAIISPTDPVAVSAVAARTPVPKRMMSILEGESLLNDASGLVCMRFAVAAMLTGSFSIGAAAGSFLWVASGGLAIGAGVTWIVTTLVGWASRRFGQDTGAQILVSLLIPFAAYLAAEATHCSGILSAVAAGITMSLRETPDAPGGARIRRTAVWDTVQLVASGSIFVLLGEQLPSILGGAGQTVTQAGRANPWWLLAYVLAIVLALAVLRFAWVWTSLRLTWFAQTARGRPRTQTSFRLVLATSLAGVRGAVTLAGVLTLPLTMVDGTPFPSRNLAVLLAAGVILTSLVLAVAFLPPILKSLELPPEAPDLTAIDQVRRRAAKAAIGAVAAAQHTLSAGRSDADVYAEAAARVMADYRARLDEQPVSAESAHVVRRSRAIERELRLAGLRAEREAIFRSGRSGDVDEAVTRRLVRDLDLLEARYGS